MLIGGINKFTLIDYPGKISAIIFMKGCNFRCPYCHNPEIVDPKKINYFEKISEKNVLDFLSIRKKDLDGVCITGGEPTLQVGLAEFLKKIKEMGFLVKVDTNGSQPATVENFIENNLVDYWAIDIKTSPKKYRIMTRKDNIVENIEKSIRAIVNSKSSLELRTTAVKGYVNQSDIDEIADWINAVDRRVFSKLFRYSIQNFRPEKTLRETFGSVEPYTENNLKEMAEKLSKHCNNIVILN